MTERSVFGNSRGLPWWGAVLLALCLTTVGVFVDMERSNSLGMVFKGAYFVGCLLAVCWVRRRALFGPMVQPPLVLAVTVPVVVLVGSGAPSVGGRSAKFLAIGAPLINGFPTMAVTTGLTLGIGLLRVLRQRTRPAGEPARPRRDDAARELEKAAAARTGAGATGSGAERAAGADGPAPAKAARPARGVAGAARQGAAGGAPRQGGPGRPAGARGPSGTRRRPRPEEI